jgi:hypothetical protein
MTVNFHNIKREKIDFKIKQDRIAFYGVYKKKERIFIEIDATIDGQVDCVCDLCSKNFEKDIRETIHLLVHDGIYVGKNESEELDIIEVEQAKIDFDEILAGELESYKNDYNYCADCSTEENIPIQTEGE